MLACIISHNILPHLAHRWWLMQRAACWLAFLPFELFAVWLIWRWRETIALRSRLTLIFLAGAFYYSTFVSFSPLRQPQTLLPFFPGIVIVVAPCFIWFVDVVWKRTRIFLFILPALIVATDIVLIVRHGSPLVNNTPDNTTLIPNALELPDES